MKLALGTVQFGLKYGISNKIGQVPPLEVKSILEFAQHCHIDMLDTAHAYGASEIVLGETLKTLPHSNFKIITKLPAIVDVQINETVIERFKAQFRESLQRLGKKALYGVLLHSGTDLLLNGSSLLENYLLALKENGHVKKIGVSVYSPEELEKILKIMPIDIVQLPMNLLDQRFLRTGLLHSLHSRNIEVHIRSVFLQGFLLMDQATLTQKFPHQLAYLNILFEKFSKMQQTPFELALGFVKKYAAEINKVVVGVTSKDELDSIVSCYETVSYDNIDYQQFMCNEAAVIDPRKWTC